MAAKKKAKAAKAKAKAKAQAKKAVSKKDAVKKASPKAKPATRAPAAKPAPTSRPTLVPRTEPSVRAGIGADLIAPGMVLHYSMADFDVSDPYTFTIREASPDGLKVHFQMGRSDEGDLAFTFDALKGARKWVSIAQGGAMLPDGESAGAIRTALPPFLLSRDVLFGLRSGDASVISEWGAGELDLQATPQKRRVTIDGVSVELAVLHATGDDIDFWVVDDDRWPVVLEHTEVGGDNFWKIHKAGKSLGAWSGEDDDENEGEEDEGPGEDE